MPSGSRCTSLLLDERQGAPDGVVTEHGRERVAAVAVVGDVEERGVAERGEAFDVGLAQPVDRVARLRPGVGHAEPLGDVRQQRALGERADRHLAALDVAVGEREALPGPRRERRLARFQLRVERREQRGRLRLLAGGRRDQLQVAAHLPEVVLRVATRDEHDRREPLHLGHGGVRQLVGGEDQVRPEGGDRVDARLAADADVLDGPVERLGLDPPAVARHVGHADRHHAERHGVLGDVPLQAHDARGGAGQGDLLSAQVGQGDGGGLRRVRRRGSGGGPRWCRRTQGRGSRAVISAGIFTVLLP